MGETITKVVTLVVTNCIKIAGLYVGVHAAVQPNPSAVVLAFSGFMMAGAQFSETTILTIVERFFGVSKKDK